MSASVVPSGTIIRTTECFPAPEKLCSCEGAHYVLRENLRPLFAGTNGVEAWDRYAELVKEIKSGSKPRTKALLTKNGDVAAEFG
jgi:hypothetical protein